MIERFKLNLQTFAGEDDNGTKAAAEGADAKKFITEVKDLKENYVSKEDYDNLSKNYKELKNAVLTGATEASTEEPKFDRKARIAELREELYVVDNVRKLNNLEFIEKTLELRDHLLAEGERDPFISPKGDRNDLQRGQEIADAFKEMVSEANGSPSVFRGIFEDALEDNREFRAAFQRISGGK